MRFIDADKLVERIKSIDADELTEEYGKIGMNEMRQYVVMTIESLCEESESND